MLPKPIHELQAELDTNKSSSLHHNQLSANRDPRMGSLTLAGKALAMAGPKPFQSAVTPSAAINLRAQSAKPV